MPLLEKIFFDKKKRLSGIPEKGKKVYLGIPTPHLKSFYTEAIYQKDRNKAWDEDIIKFREQLLNLARSDENKYYQIPEKPTETSMYDMRFAFNTFEKIE